MVEGIQKATLGLSMIVKNESATLERALRCALPFVDEIVVVDTGSTDGTVDIAKKYTDKVFFYKWSDDFSAARNFARQQVQSDYWMWLDADDVIPKKTALQIKKFMSACDRSIDVVMMPYILGFNERGKPLFSYYRERILKNRDEFVWRGRVHEAVEPRGAITRLPFPIVHAKPEDRSGGTRNLDIYRKMIERGETFTPRERYYYARELFYNDLISDAITEFTEFLNMRGAFNANRIDACVMLAKCYKKLGDPDSALSAAARGFAFGLPTGEACCEMGGIFFDKGDFRSAAYWYERALRAKPDAESGAFVDPECYGFTPLLWLTVCYDRLGDTKKAVGYHRRAQKLRPTHPSVVHNRAYFKALGYDIQ